LEGVFVPQAGGTADGRRLVLAPVLDGTWGVIYMLVLDAANMSELARAYLPVRIPYDAHGHFFPLFRRQSCCTEKLMCA
jgi:carotenoid cleavage dioxygenase-like enzyme